MKLLLDDGETPGDFVEHRARHPRLRVEKREELLARKGKAANGALCAYASNPCRSWYEQCELAEEVSWPQLIGCRAQLDDRFALENDEHARAGVPRKREHLTRPSFKLVRGRTHAIQPGRAHI